MYIYTYLLKVISCQEKKKKRKDKTSATQTRNIEGIFKRQPDTFPSYTEHHIKKCLNLVCTLGHKTAHKNAKYFMVLIFYDVEIFGVLSRLSLPPSRRRCDATDNDEVVGVKY